MKGFKTFAFLSIILFLTIGAYSLADEPKGYLTVDHYLD